MSGETSLCRIATEQDLQQLWDKNIARHPGDPRWQRWSEEYIRYNREGLGITFAAVIGGEAVGEGTLLLSPQCRAINGRTALADGAATANINALRIEKRYEGRGHISALVRMMEQYALQRGITRLTIGVEECEMRNRAIYTHWGYTTFLFSEQEDGETILYYGKEL